MIDLYFWPTGNGKKIVILLEELGLPYTIKPINIGRGDQLTPEFLKISPNGRMPAIVDDEPMGGGGPISVPSSSARITQGRGTDPRPIGNRFATDSSLEESGFEPSVPLGEKRSFRNASIRELHRVAYRGGRKRYPRRRPSGSRRSDHSNTATASELQVRPVG